MRLLLIALLAAACGCGPKIEVDSSTSWTGAVGNSTDGSTRSVSGSGHRTFSGDNCGTFQKDTEGGWLKAEVKHGGLFGGSGAHAETSASYGVVSVCE